MTQSTINNRPPAGRNADPVICLKGVTKSYGAGATVVHALRGVDLVVPGAALVMLVGPSGCGKTTLVSILSGVLDADEGQVEVFGVDWQSLSRARKTARRSELVGFVFQSFNLIPTLNAIENTSVPLIVKGVSERKARDRAAEALTDVGLGDRLSSMPSQLSGGQQQRIAIARALVGKPRLVVCDEPTAALDGKTGQQVMDLIQKAAREPDEQGRDRVVVVVTHDARIFHYADRIVEMEDGRLKTGLSEYTIAEAHHVPTFDSEKNSSSSN